MAVVSVSLDRLTVVRGDNPWRFEVARVDGNSPPDSPPFADDLSAAAQIRIYTTGATIDLTPSEEDRAAGTFVFEIDADDYADVPTGQLSSFAWWTTDGASPAAEVTQEIYPLEVIERW